MAEVRGEGPQQDIDEIVRLHRLWSDANRQGSIPMMRAAFVGGDKFFGWNLNGFAYAGIEEWATLWKFLGGSKAEVTLDEDEDLRVQVRGDTGWLTSINDFTIKLGGKALPGSGKFRSTEVYVREDEAGKPFWKMWHCHFSRVAQGPRMAFENEKKA
jgi:ketosteroid isomerase-like protein